MFDTDEQLWALYDAFRRGGIDVAEFRHRHHLALAMCYVSMDSVPQALGAFRADLLRFVRGIGAQRKYHETITRFWIEVAAHYLEARGRGRRLADVANEFVDRFGDKNMIRRHYRPESLADERARTTWIEPDLAPIG